MVQLRLMKTVICHRLGKDVIPCSVTKDMSKLYNMSSGVSTVNYVYHYTTIVLIINSVSSNSFSVENGSMLYLLLNP